MVHVYSSASPVELGTGACAFHTSATRTFPRQALLAVGVSVGVHCEYICGHCHLVWPPDVHVYMYIVHVC